MSIFFFFFSNNKILKPINPTQWTHAEHVCSLNGIAVFEMMRLAFNWSVNTSVGCHCWQTCMCDARVMFTYLITTRKMTKWILQELNEINIYGLQIHPPVLFDIDNPTESCPLSVLSRMKSRRHPSLSRCHSVCFSCFLPVLNPNLPLKIKRFHPRSQKMKLFSEFQ